MDIPLDVLTVVTGVAGSGKSTLIRGVFASVYAGRVVLVDQSPVTATGLHASDVKKVMELLDGLVARGNTVIVIEHNTDVMKQADWIIDVGPDGGSAGGEVVFTGTPREMAENSRTITAEYLRRAL